jgi:hypothetical protein
MNQTHELITALDEKLRRVNIQTGRKYMGLLEWTIKHRPLIKPNLAFDLEHHQFLRGIYECEAKKIVLMKGGQLGLSEYAVNRALWSCDVRKADVFYVMPTDGDVSDFSQKRFGPALKSSPYLASLVVNAGEGGADRVTMKRVRDNFITFRGGKIDTEGNASQLRSIDADIGVRDEVDVMNPRVKDLVSKRLGHSLIAEELSLSTPTFNSIGIHAEWMQSDQRVWCLKCPHCGTWQEIDINNVVIDWNHDQQPIAWYGQKINQYLCCCKKCHKILDRKSPGRWVAKYPSRSNDLVGFHPTKLCYPRSPLKEMVQALQSFDESKIRECWNQDLGLPYSPRGGRLTDEDLNACKMGYLPGPAGGGNLMGVDVGKVLHVIIRAPLNEQGKRPLLCATEAQPSDIPLLMSVYKVKRAVFDIGPETNMVRGIQAQYGRGRVWLCRYHTSPDGLRGVASVEWNEEDMIVVADRTRTLDLTYSRFRARENALPGNADSIPRYYSQLKAPLRQIKNGRSVYIETEADHFAHAENYCLMASLAPETAIISLKKDIQTGFDNV